MSPEGYAKTLLLFKTYLKSSKVITILLVILPFLFAYGVAASNMAILKTPEELQTYILSNQGNLLLGSIAANSLEAASIWRVRLSTALVLGVLNVVLVINHTRREEDSGRLELLRAGAVGPLAPLTATFLKIVLANILGGIGMMLGFIAVSFPVAGSFVAGMSTALTIICLAVLAAVFAQIALNARLARGLSFGAMALLLICYIIANVANSEILQLLTPFGWCAFARPYAQENWLLFLVAVPVIALLIILAFWLMAHRDFNGSYLRELKGRPAARPGFGSPLALSWRLQRSLLLVWLVAYGLMGLVIGSLKPNIDKMFAGTTFLPELSALVGGPGRAFLAILSYILTQVVTAFALMTILHFKEEELQMRAELVLSNPISRIRYISGQLLIAYLGSAGAVALFGLLTGDFVATIARIPAVWILTSAAVLFYGIVPRVAVPVSWGLFGIMLAIEFLWEMRFVGNGVFGLSPFSWVYPGMTVSFSTAVIMLLVSVLLAGIGLVGYTRRNIIPQ
jgi:ABC-2 type transport system permease protein